MPAPEWVVENWPGSATVIAVSSKGSRAGKPTDETRYYVFAERTYRCDFAERTYRCDFAERTYRCDTSLRTTANAVLQHVRDRWSIENSWHWVRDTQLREERPPLPVNATGCRCWQGSAPWRSTCCASTGSTPSLTGSVPSATTWRS